MNVKICWSEDSFVSFELCVVEYVELVFKEKSFSKDEEGGKYRVQQTL